MQTSFGKNVNRLLEQSRRESILYETLPVLPSANPAAGISFVTVVGRCPAPRVVIVAGVHGDELVGTFALAELTQELAPAALRGTVVLVPSANPFAFAAGQRKAPEDNLDLNRIFPGRSGGTPTECAAHVLTRQIIGTADLVIDLHSAGRDGDLLPLSGFREAHDDSARRSALAAAAFGLDNYWMMRWAPGTLSTWANAQGIPAVGCEVGGRGMAARAQIDLYKNGIRRCLRHAGMLDPPLAVAMPPRVWTQEHLTAPCGGLLEIFVRLGQQVQSGETLAHVRDLLGNVCAKITAPRDGKIMHTRVQQSVTAGNTVFWLGRQEDNPCYSST